ncbi:YwqG family protein [Ruminococcus sp. HUN007]|uniref:YwqG family protein n=1 Tax=Ruminococcus sp. HUN007 TaxID=1514668 RepID=UPI0005D2391D|nr:YwqG family protein [Ruminococcus sp. HUN007]
MEINRILEKVNEILPPEPAVRFSFVKEKTGLFDSKVGGTPYFPKNMEYPCGKSGSFKDQPLILLAQLNFEQIPHIPDFPEKGILQFFIAGDDLYGMASECFGEALAVQNNFRVIYHENIISDETELLSADEIPVYSGEEKIYLPFSGEYRLVPGKPENVTVTYQDFRFEDAFVKCFNEVSDEKIENLYDLDDDVFEELHENITYSTLTGGYPAFTQEDPRSSSLGDCSVLLFELDSALGNDSSIDIMWGDSGTGTFFIPRENLKNLDFSRVVYNYDCY